MSIPVVLTNVTAEFANYAATSLNNTEAHFIDCTFKNNAGSGIIAKNSQVIFKGTNTFVENSALIGGAMQLLESSQLHLEPDSITLLADNFAKYVGGAIYTGRTGNPNSCFYTLMSPDTGTRFYLINNKADFSGSTLYGGRIGGCCAFPPCKIFNTSNTESDRSAIASDPEEVCFCDKDKGHPACSPKDKKLSIDAFPGQKFTIFLAVIGAGRFYGVVPGVIRAFFDSPMNATLGEFQMTQTSKETPSCKNFKYSVNSTQTDRKIIFHLTSEQSFFQIVTGELLASADLTIEVYLMNCPIGFSLSAATGTCECQNHKIECDIDDQSLLRPANSWIGFVSESSTDGAMFHPNCPIGYCLPRKIRITHNTSDSQCESHRTGLLCGECEKGYSLTLSNGECAKCSNYYLFILLPLAVAGLLLVALLFALNLTVTEGSINGLIFFANVIAMNQAVRFSKEASYLYTFLAWLNLDLGVNTCLFDGMDAYVETWLQFAFPVYLWVIILVIILFYSKFPNLANKMGGENAVKVLATLLLLSYTKLQRSIVTIMAFTSLEYPNSVVRYVWLYDANVEFFKGKHLYLGIAGILVLVFLIMPYTLCLAFFQQLQACSGHRLFQWVNKLKPVFDAYAGPYKDKYRFWTGMLLVVRTLLIILFTGNIRGSVEFNLLIISIVSCVLLMVNANGIYKKWYYNYLESFFYLQLAVFATGLWYARFSGGDIIAVEGTSFGLTLVVFLAVLGYHILCSVPCFRKCYYHHFRGYADINEDDLLLQERAPPEPELDHSFQYKDL